MPTGQPGSSRSTESLDHTSAGSPPQSAKSDLDRPVTLHLSFRGGPLDGQVLPWTEAIPEVMTVDHPVFAQRIVETVGAVEIDPDGPTAIDDDVVYEYVLETEAVTAAPGLGLVIMVPRTCSS